ncbi:CU044_5270 family protein [Actinomadura hibisca]|uniref:CU044_5270 family protein n=1 Tax=Actinomadura hibisca TaxID=68565 RepID=UPI00082C215D|nr:CU044_5270 family protein [Actinomadura hibisca]
MSTDELITTFRDGRPEVAPYDAVDKARLRLRVQSGEPAPTRRSARRPLLLAGALTGAFAVGGGVLVAVQPGGGEPPARVRQVSAVTALAEGAERAARGPEGALGPRQWVYLKSVYAPTQEGGAGPALFGRPGKLVTREMWRRTDEKAFAFMEGGKLRVASGSKFVPSGPLRMDYPTLLALPDNATAMLAHIRKIVDAEERQSRSRAQKGGKLKPGTKTPPPPPAPLTAAQRDARAFDVVSQYLRGALFPARQRAALYGALAKIPSVRYAGRADDLAGRRGVSLYLDLDGKEHHEVFVDPKTYSYLGFRVTALRSYTDAGRLGVRKGQILGWGSLTAAKVAAPGKRS